MILASQDQMDLNMHKMANVCGVLLVYALCCSMDTNCATENTFRPTIDTVYSPYFRSQSMFQANPVKVESPSGDPVLAFFLDRSNRLQSKIEVNMDTEFTATFDVIVVCANPDVGLVAEVTVDGLESISIVGENRFMFSCSNLTGTDLFDPAIILQRQNSSNYVRQREVFVAERQIHVKLISGVIGFGTLHFRLYNLTSGTENYNSRNDTTLHTDQNNKTLVLSEENTYESLTYTVTVVRKIRIVDKLFRICIFCVQIFVATGFGAKLHLDVVKENVLKPIAPCIGLASQYLIMPLR
ncbi:hypothetical protein MAR_026339 [Mya arenaria]|uniref:Uncharacterized protein n=1 Tax=Mya arenaria TaxID=6604 RepID=A0ABY7ETA0_MYAAR|nr:hypothetical protein MAR_026339 [Mya arenaria]